MRASPVDPSSPARGRRRRVAIGVRRAATWIARRSARAVLPVRAGDPTLRTLAAFYLFSYCGSGALFPFLPVLLSGYGFSPTEISLVMMMSPLLSLAAPPIWGSAADALHARVALLRIISFGSGLTSLLLYLRWGVPFAVIAMGVFCFFRTPIGSLADAATHAALGERRDAFALVRVWGSVGFALGAALAGLLDTAGRPELIIAASSGIYLLSGVVALRLVSPPIRREPGLISRAIQYLRGSGLITLYVANAFYYSAHATFDVHFGLHLQNLGYRDLLGAAWFIAVLSEVVLMFYAPRMMAGRRSMRMLLFCSIISIIRWMLLSVITDRSMLIALQVLHAVTFGLWYLSLVRYVQERAPEELRASAQAALLATMGVGTIAGYLIGGRILETHGGAAMFRAAAVGALIAFGIYALPRLQRSEDVEAPREAMPSVTP